MGTWRMALLADSIQKTATMPFQFENCSVRAIVRDGASIQRGLGLLRADREGGRDPCGRLRGGETMKREDVNIGMMVRFHPSSVVTMTRTSTVCKPSERLMEGMLYGWKERATWMLIYVLSARRAQG